MQVKVLSESGFLEALLGIGLSFGLTSGKNYHEMLQDKDSALWDRLHGIAEKLAHKGNAENKFLRQISVVLDVDAPIYWWKQADTYKVGTTAQSESTMHTLKRTPITQDRFEHPIFPETIKHLEGLRQSGDFELLVNELPCGWLQRRILTYNYAVIQNIYQQRRHHKLKEWHIFIDSVLNKLEFPYLITKDFIKGENDGRS